ncbi:peroxiredoxin family protein [Leptolyngbya sp. PCC 6406]|uniref:peroxiredoxin family protein n=1 Tax=Leptolyngbya sp. PCC 6406 TaxID=1173264 RepID=UPI0002AC9704|nr:redoxin domain-containing protein [Leptolyngbya sp. PCC 6406]
MEHLLLRLPLPSLLLSPRFWQNFWPLPATSRLALGDRAPDFCLTEVVKQTPLRLSHYWGDRPVVLAFTRIFTERHYCPICFPHLLALRDAYSLIQQAGAELLLITSTDLAQSQDVVKDLGLTMPVLSDAQCQVFHQYGTGQALGAPLPAQFVLDRYGRIRFWHHFSFWVPNANPTRLLYALSTLPPR